MKLTSDSFEPNERIPVEFAFGKHHEENHIEFSDNMNPQLSWTELPAGTQSLVLICHDPDVPSVGDNVNQAGKTVAAELPRVDFFHWVLVDIPPDVTHIPSGEHSKGVTARGKAGPAAPGGMRHGLTNYTEWFAGDSDMSGQYFGYDGPCPPWNDEIVHNYHFTLYALDTNSCAVSGNFTGIEVLAAIKGHVLGQATLSGKYSINPNAHNKP